MKIIQIVGNCMYVQYGVIGLGDDGLAYNLNTNGDWVRLK